MTRRSCWAYLLTGAVLFGISTVAAGAEDPNKVFASVFGGEAKKVSATYSKKDDAEFAEKLFAAGEKTSGSPQLRQILYGKAYEFGIRDKAGYAVAADAMRRLLADVPQRKLEWNEKLLAVYELQYRLAPRQEKAGQGTILLEHLLVVARAEMQSGAASLAAKHYDRALLVARQIRSGKVTRIGGLLAMARAQERAERLIVAAERAHKANPTDKTAAMRLLMLHLVEADDPAKAAELMPVAGPDEAIKTCLPLATKSWPELQDGAMLDLGGWYETLARKASVGARLRMQLRARAYYDAYLTLRDKEDAGALRAKVALGKLDKQLKPFGPMEGGFVGPPKGVTRKLYEWTKHRDSLAPAEQIEAIAEKLSEVNAGKKIIVQSHKAEGNLVIGLDVHRNKDLRSIAPLYGMKLRSLRLSGTAVDDLRPLRGMRLTELDISGCEKLTYLSGLEGMPLRKIKFDGCGVESLAALRGIRLTKLGFLNCLKLKSLRGLEGMPLTTLGLCRAGAVKSLEPIRGMPLEDFRYVISKGVKDFSPLRGLRLTHLELHYTSITELSVLKGMPLEHLSLNSCDKLRSLRGIEGLPLTYLDLGHTKFATKAIADALKRKIPTLKELKIK